MGDRGRAELWRNGEGNRCEEGYGKNSFKVQRLTQAHLKPVCSASSVCVWPERCIHSSLISLFLFPQPLFPWVGVGDGVTSTLFLPSPHGRYH